MSTDISNRKHFSSVYLSGILLLLGIVISISLWTKAQKAALEYTTVEAMVESVETIYPKGIGEHLEYKVKVLFNGKEYELQNVIDGFSYYSSQKIQAFYADDVLYENIEGIKSNTNEAYIYFVSLGVIVLLLACFLYHILSFFRK
ncbi:hypothetical protein KBI51_08860 [Aerococcaceae bacterium zg-ZUI334]|uniref:hypothetical protein n=1 Tax=Aerococcaceae bacterium zg-252 TaxID=2796928 RepID=UPI001B991822|nr:hypothetical protein [Aerococcaceae bacterium zg-ZUI334]